MSPRTDRERHEGVSVAWRCPALLPIYGRDIDRGPVAFQECAAGVEWRRSTESGAVWCARCGEFDRRPFDPSHVERAHGEDDS